MGRHRKPALPGKVTIEGMVWNNVSEAGKEKGVLMRGDDGLQVKGRGIEPRTNGLKVRCSTD